MINYQEKNNSGVVSGIIEERWNKIEDSIDGFEISNFGNVRVKIKNNLYKELPKFEQKTSKGTYLYARIYYPEIGIKLTAIHQLVIKSFLGNPPNDGLRYEPNHMDGNKHNNRSDNLEWMTRSQNVLHAFETGLCTVGTRIVLKDIINDTETKFNTFSSLCRFLNLSRDSLRTIIIKYKDIPYLNRWIFSIDNSSDNTIKRYQRLEVICKDYISNKVIIANDANEMSLLTNTLSGTITSRTRDNSNIKDKHSLINGYVFKKLSDETPWPIYSLEEAQLSRNKYLDNLKENKAHEKWLRKNYLTNEVTEHKSLNDACKIIELSIGKICDLTINHKQGKIDCIKGYAFKKVSNVKPWPNFTDEEIEISINNTSSGNRGKAIRVTDTILNTTKIYAPASNFAREIGLNPNTITVKIRDSKSKLFLDKYKIDFLT